MNREKVIKAIEICIGDGHCSRCGYHLSDYHAMAHDCRDQMMADAIALLKEQETTNTGKRRIFQCEKCGYGIDDIYLSNEHDFDIYPHFCPNCGRRVK